MKYWGFVYKETEFIGQKQSFQRRRRSRCKGHKIVEHGFE
jgi:hypothetical protein